MEAVRWYVYSYSFHQTFYVLEKITLQETKFVAFCHLQWSNIFWIWL